MIVNNMTALSQAYIHLTPFSISAQEEKYLEVSLKNISFKITQEIYSVDIEIDVQIERGSLRTWVTMGTLLVTAIAQYGSFRSGIDYLVTDAREAAQRINSSLIETIKADPQQIYHQERRSCIPGQLQRIIIDLDYINENINTMDLNSRSLQIENINRKLRKLMRSIDSEDDMKYIVNSLKDDKAINNLPRVDQLNLLKTLKKESCIHCFERRAPYESIKKDTVNMVRIQHKLSN